MGKPEKTGRWSVDQRLEFIDFRLFWEGRFNRRDLVDHFGVSVPQASADLTLYQEQAKGNALYDKTLKTYIAGPKFRPVFFQPEADSYLAQLRLIESGLLSKQETWATLLPSYSIVPILRRHIDATTLRGVINAIRVGTQVHITYQSMSHSEPTGRWVSPHALGFDGYRWHARAWCHTRNGFVDFLLARILNVADSKPTEIDPTGDIAWQRLITLRFAPHPELKDGKRKAVELDFGMTSGFVEITTRVCMSYYLERQFGLDSESPLAKAERHQIVLVNRDELEAARQEVGDACGVSAAKAEKHED